MLAKKTYFKAACQKGETLVETLVSLLISSLALLMLATMVSASAYTIKKSNDRINKYYESNNDISSLSGTVEAGTIKITLKDESNNVYEVITDVPYYNNSEDSKVIRYKI